MVIMETAMTEKKTAADNRYTVLGPLGEGGVGAVYRAWDRQLSREVALKRLKGGEDISQALQQEAQLLASLRHPNIVTVLDIGNDDMGPFVVMELIAGRTLEKIVSEQTSVQYSLFLEIASQSFRGLMAAHAHRIVHRDLKPGNLMLAFHEDGSFTLKILDFGMAKSVLEPTEQTMDQNNSVMGSVYTMAPEQMTRQPVDARTDIYSLGCVFYYILAGHYPYTGATLLEVVHKHLEGNVRQLHQIRPDLPRTLCDGIMKMMARQPEDRFQTIEEAKQTLLAGLTSTTPILPQSSGKSIAIVWTSAAAFILSGFAAFFIFAKNEPQKQLATVAIPVEKQDAAIDPTETKTLKTKIGETVSVQGTVMRSGVNKKGNRRYLNFTNDYRRGVALMFLMDTPKHDFSEEWIQSHVGQTVRATGCISEYEGRLQMEITSKDQIQPQP